MLVSYRTITRTCRRMYGTTKWLLVTVNIVTPRCACAQSGVTFIKGAGDQGSSRARVTQGNAEYVFLRTPSSFESDHCGFGMEEECKTSGFQVEAATLSLTTLSTAL